MKNSWSERVWKVGGIRAAPPRTISGCIALAEQREKDRGYRVTLDPDFASDVELIIQSRKPWNPPTFD